MHKINSSKKVMLKKTAVPRKVTHKDVKCLELTVKKNSGKYTKLSLPIKEVCVQTAHRKVSLVKIVTASKPSITIDNISSTYIRPKSLLHKKIHAKKDGLQIEGTIVKVVPIAKSPEGEPVPAPPPPLP